MGKFKLYFVLGLILLLLLEGASAAPSTTSPAKIVTGFLSNSVPAITKWVWSLKATTRTAVSGKSMMKFESGYSVETVFDGSKLGIEPYAVEVLHNGELLILDSDNNSRPKLVTGSAEGYSGHVDGKLREARMNHPKGITVDDRGNVYVADTMNMAIRKISDTGVTTIAGGKWSRGGSHVDGPSEEAKFSNDFDVFYVRSSCSILVIDRGNQAIREIQLHFDDCAYQYGSGFPLGKQNQPTLLSRNSVNYKLRVVAFNAQELQCLFWLSSSHRLSTIVAAQDAQGPAMSDISPSPYQKSSKSYRPILIPSEDEPDKQDEGLFGSIGKLLANAMASVVEIMGGLFPGFRSKPQSYRFQRQPLFEQPQKQVKDWSVQESFVIPDEDEPPSIDTRSPTPRKTYPFMSKDAEKMQELWRSQAFYTRWNGNLQQQQQKHNHHHQYHSSIPHTYYEQSHEATNEILFGAVQEQEYVVVKPVNYGDSLYDNHNIRSRISSVGDIHKY
ncbi:hypothetical protein Lal_00026339 [Lupinus albus]|nr:hypothetical protein Lal_00026339 [Lupinus albus]